MLFLGSIAGAIGGIFGGGGWGEVIGSVLGGIFGGGGSNGWLGGIMDLIGGLFGKREDAANQSVNREFANRPVPERSAPEREAESTTASAEESSGEECCCCCCGSDGPSESEGTGSDPSSSPSGGLEVEGNVITTEGGYTIEMLGPAEWQITGPDGKTTRIWGDPHVAEGDRTGTSEANGGWDFKDNTTFVLGDGTEIHVTTVPRDNGSTVTGQLNIVNGDHAVEVTGIDQGMGEIGEVTTNGEEISHQYSGYQDIYQGAEADDWSYNGREIVGSSGRGEQFELDDELAPGTDVPVSPEAPGQRQEAPAPASAPADDDGNRDGLDDSLFAPMSLTFNFGDLTFTLGVEENDEARA